MILVMLSKLLWASSLIASCFSCFTVKVLTDFRVMIVAREKNRLVKLKAMSTGRLTPLANDPIEIPLVITVDVIRPVSTMAVIVLNRFISSSKYASTSVNFLGDMFVVLVVV